MSRRDITVPTGNAEREAHFMELGRRAVSLPAMDSVGFVAKILRVAYSAGKRDGVEPAAKVGAVASGEPIVRERYRPDCSCDPRPVESATVVTGAVKSGHPVPDAEGRAVWVTRTLQWPAPKCRICSKPWRMEERFYPESDFPAPLLASGECQACGEPHG